MCLTGRRPSTKDASRCDLGLTTGKELRKGVNLGLGQLFLVFGVIALGFITASYSIYFTRVHRISTDFGKISSAKIRAVTVGVVEAISEGSWETISSASRQVEIYIACTKDAHLRFTGRKSWESAGLWSTRDADLGRCLGSSRESAVTVEKTRHRRS